METKRHHNIRIETPDGEVTTARNTKILVDGVELLGVRHLEFTLGACEVGTLRLEMDANIEMMLNSKIALNYQRIILTDELGVVAGKVTI